MYSTAFSKYVLSGLADSFPQNTLINYALRTIFFFSSYLCYIHKYLKITADFQESHLKKITIF